nr:hypothetical protein [Candidatus Levybacteria bacterium]
MRKSRLSKYSEKKTRKTIILNIVGIIIVLYLLFKFGIGLLINFSLFLSGSKDQQGIIGQNILNYIAPPTLNPLPTATNSAQIKISGKSVKDAKIELFINDDKIDETDVDDKGEFSFENTLKNGNSQIKARVVIKNKKSDFSNTLNIIYTNSAPSLEISSPQDGAQFKKDQNTANVTGKTDPAVNVTVNGFWAVISDNNNFSYNLPLQNGDNEIKVVAIDQAGNKTEKTIKVNYSQ